MILLQSEFLDDVKSLTPIFENCEVRFDDRTFSVGVSFGFSTSTNELEFEIISARAEIACKKAKTLGDGILVEWTEELDQTALQSFRVTCPTCETINSCEVPSRLELERLTKCAACGRHLS